MYTADYLNDRLQEEFSGRLRLRRSAVREDTLFVEERVGRGVFDGVARLPFKSRAQRERRFDAMVRLTEGYNLVLTLRAGDRFPCPQCRATLKTPMMEVREVKCPICATTSIEAFFPLNDSLTDYLKSIDPLRADARSRVKALDEVQRRDHAIRDKDFDAGLHDELYDNAISQIPKVGYTGKEKAWDRT